jgi:Fur family ferric uptake transcriptional regulator
MQQCCKSNHYLCKRNNVAVKLFKPMKSARNTTAKTEIQVLITTSNVALSHSEIQKLLEGLCDRVTIYRVLERLLEEGTIHKIVNVDGVVKYAGCHSCSVKHSHNHIHFSCQKCKSVTCLEDVEPSYKLPKNYKVSEMNFTLSGLCPQCS